MRGAYEMWELKLAGGARCTRCGNGFLCGSGASCWRGALARTRGAGVAWSAGHKDTYLSASERVETVRPLMDVQLWMFNQVSKAYVHKARQFKRVHFKL